MTHKCDGYYSCFDVVLHSMKWMEVQCAGNYSCYGMNIISLNQNPLIVVNNSSYATTTDPISIYITQSFTYNTVICNQDNCSFDSIWIYKVNGNLPSCSLSNKQCMNELIKIPSDNLFINDIYFDIIPDTISDNNTILVLAEQTYFNKDITLSSSTANNVLIIVCIYCYGMDLNLTPNYNVTLITTSSLYSDRMSLVFSYYLQLLLYTYHYLSLFFRCLWSA